MFDARQLLLSSPLLISREQNERKTGKRMRLGEAGEGIKEGKGEGVGVVDDIFPNQLEIIFKPSSSTPPPLSK